MIPVLTREEDSFVPLQERMTLARAAGADVSARTVTKDTAPDPALASTCQ